MTNDLDYDYCNKKANIRSNITEKFLKVSLSLGQ